MAAFECCMVDEGAKMELGHLMDTNTLTPQELAAQRSNAMGIRVQAGPVPVR